MELDLPTFEEIDKGYFSFEVQGRYLGLDLDGEPRFANTHKLEVIVKHNYYDCLFKLFVGLDKQNKPCQLFWSPSFVHQYDHKFEYSEAGYQQLKESMVREIQWLAGHINRLFKI